MTAPAGICTATNDTTTTAAMPIQEVTARNLELLYRANEDHDAGIHQIHNEIAANIIAMHAVQQQQDHVVKAGAQIHSTPVLKKRGAPAATTTVVVDDKHQIRKPPPQELTDNSQSLKADGVGDLTTTTVSASTMLSVSTFGDHEGTVTISDQTWF